MTRFIPQLAAAEDPLMQKVSELTKGTRVHTREMMFVVVIALAVGVLLFLWVYLRHRSKADRADGRELSRFKSSRGERESRGSSGRRRRRRSHRKRNPSLDQTGGLPPPRPEGDLPKY
jgi:hypothetical protein